MKRIIALASVAMLAFSAASVPSSAGNALIGGGAVFGGPSVQDPVCAPGFITVTKTSWLLRCRTVVPIAQYGVALTTAQTAVCNTWSYWNYGPNATGSIQQSRGTATVEYVCGHVEG